MVNPYPAHEERDVVLRAGSTLRLRPIRPDDDRALLAFYERLSPDSLYFRFFSMRHLDAAAAARICAVDYENQFALVGEVGGKIVAISQYFRFPKHPERAEAAFVVEDALQGQGIGTRLLERLAEIARDRGIRSFEADVLPQNTRMLDVFRNCGFAEQERRFEFGSQKVLLDITPTPAYEQHAADRSEAAAYASMRRLFEPGVVAVVGASAERGKIGAEIFHNLHGRFRGTVVPVNRKHHRGPGRSVLPERCRRRRPGGSRRDRDPGGRRRGGRRRVASPRASTGSWSSRPDSRRPATEGRRREAALLEKVRAAGIRMVGPNCMGLLNTDPRFRLDATVRAGLSAGGPRGPLLAERSPRPRPARLRRLAQPRHLDASCPSATRPTCRATT